MLAISNEAIGQLRAAVRQRIRSGERDLKQLRLTLSDLDAADRLLGFVESDSRLQALALGRPQKPESLKLSAGNPHRADSIAAIIWEVLDFSSEPWLRTKEVQSQASDLVGREVLMSTIASTLSRMTSVVRKGRKVASRQRVMDQTECDVILHQSQQYAAHPGSEPFLLLQALDKAIP